MYMIGMQYVMIGFNFLSQKDYVLTL